MIGIEEVSPEGIGEFWDLHYSYLVGDGLATDDEDKDYFSGREYRSVIEAHIARETDRHTLAYFTLDGRRIGAVSYCIYTSEDGKCFILDFWVFPPYRGAGNGHKCFAALKEYTAARGAVYYEINCDGRADRLRFWKSCGFTENGRDEYDMPLLAYHPA